MPDDGQEWMTMIEMLDEHEVDALLGGTAPAEELAPVAAVVTRLRERAAAEPAPPMSAALRAQLYAPPVVSLHAHRATRFAFARAAVAAAVAALALVGVGAAQNRLPSSVQDVVSSTAELVGIDVPRSDERHATDDGSDDGSDDGTSEVPSTEGTDGTDGTEVPGGTERQDQGDPGHEGTTPGGATPADPGTPGDKQPATPATPPSNPGNAGGNSGGNANNGNNGNNGQPNGTGTDNAPVDPGANGQGNGNKPA
jgi:hypothetical protein